MGETFSQYVRTCAITTELPNEGTFDLECEFVLGDKFELNMVKGEDNRFYIQYIRVTESGSLGGKGAVTPGVVKFGAGVSVFSSKHFSESLPQRLEEGIQKTARTF